MNKKTLVAVAGLAILAASCKENDTIKPSPVTDSYAYQSQNDSSNSAESDTAINKKIVLPIKTQPIEQPGPNPSLGKGKDLLEQVESN